MGSRGFSLANFKILLRELSDKFNCTLILFRGMPAFHSSMVALFSAIEKDLFILGLATAGMTRITGQSDRVQSLL